MITIHKPKYDKKDVTSLAILRGLDDDNNVE